MSIFNVRIPGLRMTVVQADGLNIVPVKTDEFQIAVAETYDVIVTPAEDRAFTLIAEASARSGLGRATLAQRAGTVVEGPPLLPPPPAATTDMGTGDVAPKVGGGVELR